MIKRKAILEKFKQHGDKTGWTYIFIPADIAQQLKPGNKKAFRVKGKLNQVSFKGISLVPMGEGNFILPVKAALIKQIALPVGAAIDMNIEADDEDPHIPPPAFIECLNEEPEAAAFFNSLPKSHQRHFIRWILEAKTSITQEKRMAASINALAQKRSYGEMIRSLKHQQ